MTMECPDSILGRSTVHPDVETTGRVSSASFRARHAAVVVNRMLRTSARSNDKVADRVVKAAVVLNAASPSETAFVSGRPVDVAMRIATRIVRRLGVDF